MFAIGSSYHLCQVKPTEEKVTNFLVNERTTKQKGSCSWLSLSTGITVRCCPCGYRTPWVQLLCIEALEEVIQYYGPPDIFNSDQGCEFTSTEFTQKLLNQSIWINMDGKGRWIDNLFIERLLRNL